MSKKPLIQDGDEVREMTAKEFTEYQQLQAELAAIEDAKAAKAIAREELLTRLGITAAEAQLLLGA
jgi:arsenate reductase-like glutaredoxin family protein